MNAQDNEIERWNRIEELYGEALGCAPEERNAFLDERCGDPELRQGPTLEPYEDLSPIGSGATGEIYRAHDSRLGRPVALKVLHQQFTDDPAALSRFVREARAASALNHPNIITVHEVGSPRRSSGARVRVHPFRPVVCRHGSRGVRRHALGVGRRMGARGLTFR